jgi:hypothetical protein
MNYPSSLLVLSALLGAHPALCQTSPTPKTIFKNLKNSSATIIALNPEGKSLSQGSAVLIEKNIVVTNFHVVANGSRFVVVIDEKRFEPTSILYRQDIDLAYLKFDSPLGLPVKRGNSLELNVGDKIYTIGSPLGLDQTLSDGLISSFRFDNGVRYIQTTAPISPGSSGGGLFDKSGKLIGITTFTMIKGQNLNFAIPIEEILPYSTNNLKAIKFPITTNDKIDDSIDILTRAISEKTLAVSEPIIGGLSNGKIIMSICTNTRISFSKDCHSMFVRHTGDYSASPSGNEIENAPDQEIIIPLARVAFTIGSQQVSLGKKENKYYNITAISVDGSKCILSNTAETQGSDSIVFVASKSKDGLEDIFTMLNQLKQKINTY